MRLKHLQQIADLRRERDDALALLSAMRANITAAPEQSREKMNDEAGAVQATVNKLAEIITALEQRGGGVLQ